MSVLSLLAQEEIYEAPRPKTPVYIDNREELLNDEETPTKQKRNERYADEDSVQKKFDPSKLRIGGNFGLQFGNYTSINLAPTLSYFFIPNRLQFGVGPILLFQSIRLNNGSRLKTTAYGGQLFLRGYVWNGLFLQARYDMVNKESYYKYPERINVSHLLIGGGYSTSISNVGRFYVSALIDVINDN